jgi:hypothetical protein
MNAPPRAGSSLLFGGLVLLHLACSHPEPRRSQEPAPTTEARVGDADAQGGNMGRTPKDEATDLMNMLLPFAEKMLRGHGEFYPYGGGHDAGRVDAAFRRV